jgi:hypothetical protein
MTTERKTDDPLAETAVQVYIYVCLTALVVLFLVLVRRGMGSGSFIPAVIGILGLGLRWRLAPLVTVIALTFLLYARQPVVLHFSRRFNLFDWILSAALLAYFAGHYRLQGLTHSILPIDPRRRSSGAEPDQPAGATSAAARIPRDPRLVQSAEVGWILLSLPVLALTAQLIWRFLPQGGARYGLDAGKWRGLVLAWLTILVLLGIAGLLRYLNWRNWSRRQARMVLEDALWQETRREQRRLAVWTVWARGKSESSSR